MSQRRTPHPWPRFTRVAAALALGLLAADAALATHFRYMTTNWQRFNLDSSFASGLNDAGQAVGSMSFSNTLIAESAFVGTNAGPDASTLLPDNGRWARGSGINAAGTAVGTSWVNPLFYGRRQATVFDDGQIQLLGTLGGLWSEGLAINAAGHVVGSAARADGSGAAFVWRGSGPLVQIADFGGDSAVARSINGRGWAVGTAENAQRLPRAFLWNSVATVALETPGNTSQANAIDEAGLVVGSANLSAFGAGYAAIWEDGQHRRLGSGDNSSNALGLNDRGLVVGTLNRANTAGAFVFNHGDTGNLLHDLNGLLDQPLASGARLVQATAVNNEGQITALSSDQTAVLLTPAGTLHWAARNGGNFMDGLRWDSGVGQGPSRFLDMELSSSASQTVTHDAAVSVRSLVVGSDDPGAGRMTLRFVAGGTVGAVGTDRSRGVVAIARSGIVSGDGGFTSDVVNHGTIDTSGTGRTFQDRSYVFRNHGLITGEGLFDANLVNESDGQIRIGAGRWKTFRGGGLMLNDGAIEVLGGELEFLEGQVDNRSGGRIRLDNGTVRFADGLLNAGSVQIGFGGASVFGVVDTLRGGLVVASGGSETVFWDAVRNNGEMRAGAGSRIVYFGAVDGAGRFTTHGDGAYHRFEGGYAPGNSPADGVLGNTQLASTLAMELGGPVPGTQHDRIAFTGSLLLDSGAVLVVTLLDGFVPQLGQVFDLFEFAQAPRGLFEALDLPPLDAGLRWDSSALYTLGDLRVAAVPEPASALLLALGVVALHLRRRAVGR
jgi:hypothetical protein